MMRASELLTATEQEKINLAVAAAEKGTSGEIVPVVATASGRYDRAEDVGGLLLALTALTATWVQFQRIVPVEGDWSQGQRLTLGLPWIILIVVAGFAMGAAITSRVGWWRRLLVRESEMRQEVERAAWQAFGQFRVGRTAGGTGILLYISLFERTVCVLGDEAIAAKLDAKTWEGVRDTILEGLRSGQPAEALCRAVAQCGEILGQHFPYRAGDVNELTDELRLLN